MEYLNCILFVISIIWKGPVYEEERGVHYGGLNIVGDQQPNGKCGYYNTREELKAACTATASCTGYTMSTIKENNDAVEENGFYPGCLKETKEGMQNDSAQIYYAKVPEPGTVD